MIEFHILGATTLRKEDGDFDQSFLAGPKRLALLTYLTLARPRGYQRRDKLVALFWPDRGQKSARNALSNMLYQIRDALGEEAIINRGTEEIRINPEKVWCDAIAFEEALDEGEIHKALDLYHGDPLPGFHVTNVSNEFSTWLDSERERLRKRSAEASWMLAEKAEQAEDLASARRWANKAVFFTGLSEESYERLIIFLYDMGDRSGALRAYEEFATLMRQEWEMEPSDKLKAFVEKISEQNSAESDSPTKSTKVQGSNTAVDESLEPTADTQQHFPEIQASVNSAAELEGRRVRNKYGWWSTVVGVLLVTVASAWALWPEGTDISATNNRSVAVLPFTYLGAEDSKGYLSLGMTEEILTRLAQVSDLSVISRTSVMQYQNTEKSLRDIGRELGVTAIVEGSVQQQGDRVRIYAQLIDAKTDHHLWSKSYDRELKNIFAVQSDIAKSIAGELKAELAPGVEERIERVPTEDLVAYELFLRGREHYSRSTKEANNTAIGLLRQALGRDPDFALARAALAEAYAKDAWNFGANVQWSDSAVAEAERAVAQAPDLADAHAALGFARMTAGRFSIAIRSIERALELNSSDWGAVNDIGIINLQTGNIAEAIRNWKQALKGDPARAHGHRFNLALAYRILGLLGRAEQANRASLAMEPDFVFPVVNQAHVELFRGDTVAAMNTIDPLTSKAELDPYALQSAGWIYIFANQPDRARSPLERAYELSPAASGEGYVRVLLGYSLWQAGERERAKQLFEEFENYAAEQIKKGNEYGMLLYSMAEVHAIMDEKEKALQWLERAVFEAGWPYELTTIHDPMLSSLRDEERFQKLIEQMRERNELSRQQLARDEGIERTDQLQPKKVEQQ